MIGSLFPLVSPLAVRLASPYHLNVGRTTWRVIFGIALILAVLNAWDFDFTEPLLGLAFAFIMSFALSVLGIALLFVLAQMAWYCVCDAWEFIWDFVLRVLGLREWDRQ